MVIMRSALSSPSLFLIFVLILFCRLNARSHSTDVLCMSTCYSAPSRFLLRGAPDYSADTESEFHAEAHEQLRVKDLPRVPTRRLEVDSNPQPSGCKAPNIPLHHRAPRCDRDAKQKLTHFTIMWQSICMFCQDACDERSRF